MMLPLLVLSALLAQTQPPQQQPQQQQQQPARTRNQPRNLAAPAAAPATPTAAPARAAAPQGRRGAGGIGGPGPAVGGQIDESLSITHHTIKLDSSRTPQLHRDRRANALEGLRGRSGSAHLLHGLHEGHDFARTTKRAAPLRSASTADPARHPFGSTLRHGMGPRSPRLQATGAMPPPPYRLVDNQNTWLDETDLVFIDPVGTGYSRAKNIEVARHMNGVEGDIQSVGEFIRMYVQRNGREASTAALHRRRKATAHSSCAAGLAGYLVDRGIAFNGIVLIGTTLNLETIWSRSDDLVYQLEFPTYAADAWYHKKAAPDLQKKDLKAFLKDAEAFAMGEYSSALNKGDAELPARPSARQ